MLEKKERKQKEDGWFSRLFQPEKDFFGLLAEQATITLEGMEALEKWINEGAHDRCQLVRDLEHKADKHKLKVAQYLVGTLITPMDREDIYDLSARLDEVINTAKRAVREMEAFQLGSAGTELPKMSTILVDGTRSLLSAFDNLGSDLVEASTKATLARKADARLDKLYRTSMPELFKDDDVKRIMKIVEVYRTMAYASSRIDIVGEKLLHVIVKMS